MSYRQFYHVGINQHAGPVGPPSERPLVTSARLEEGPGHDRLTIWNRGGCAGTLVVNLGDGMRLLDLVLSGFCRTEMCDEDDGDDGDPDFTRDEDPVDPMQEGWQA